MHVIVLHLHIRHEGSRLLGIFTMDAQDAAQDAARDFIAADRSRNPLNTWGRSITRETQWEEETHGEATLTLDIVTTNCMLTKSN